MKPAPFAYAKASTLEDALSLLAEHGDDARILAGGQSLMATLNMRLSAPQVLVDINRIDGLAGSNDMGGALRIGARTRHSDVEASDLIAQHAPLIAAAVDHIAHPAIRTRGTFGGSIAFAAHAAELPACAMALDATMHIAGLNGERDVPAADFFEGLYETAIQPGEILTGVSIPKIADGWKSGFMEPARRRGDYAIIGIAAQAKFDGSTFGDARLVYFNAGDRPVSTPQTAALLNGQGWSDDMAEKLAASLKRELDPPDDLNADGPMRKHLAGVLAKRVLGPMAGA